MLRSIRVASVVIVGLALAWCVLLFFVQRRILFPAPVGKSPQSRQIDVQGVRLEPPSGPLRVWFLPTTATAIGPVPLLLFTHGNGELADDWLDKFEDARRDGFAVLVAEYPGYGHSTGSPTERSIGDAVRAAYDWASKDPRIDPGSIFAYGRSLGGGAATELAATRPVRALILQSSFTSVPALAWQFFVPGFLVRDRFDNLAKLRRLHVPLLVLHGEQDRVVPIEQGRELARSVDKGEFLALPCGHNDCADAWPAIRSFLDRRRLVGTGRRAR